MTAADKAKALEILAATEMVTGMELSTVLWGVSRQQTDAEPDIAVKDTTTGAGGVV